MNLGLNDKLPFFFYRNTRAEFKRLKTILPSIKRKENVSKLDIILEAIKYIDDLQDQLFDRLSGTHSQREATLLALTEEDMERSRARLNALRDENADENQDDMSTDEELDLDESKASVSSDEDSHHSLELWIYYSPTFFHQINLTQQQQPKYRLHIFGHVQNSRPYTEMYCLKKNSSCDNKVWIFSWVLLGLHLREERAGEDTGG